MTDAELTAVLRWQGSALQEGSFFAAADRIEQLTADKARLRADIEYVLDGYGLNAPDFKRQPEDDDEDDWIVLRLRAALDTGKVDT